MSSRQWRRLLAGVVAAVPTAATLSVTAGPVFVTHPAPATFSLNGNTCTTG